LVYKTQVFVNHEGDLFRTRLTHSLEVAQLGRSIARSLALNEDLVEAIALAHDLGHTPFGHAGQDALNLCMSSFGGFEHNFQSLRVVDELEQRYPSWNGLNLCFETREGILKHCSKANAMLLESRDPDGVGRRFLEGGVPSLEAQLSNLADEIAYNAHDIDDGVRSGLLTLEQLNAVPLFVRFRDEALGEYDTLGTLGQGRRLLYETIRRMLSAQVYDVIAATAANISASGVQTEQEVRSAGTLVAFSPSMRAESNELKRFLFSNLYRHSQVLETMQHAKRIVEDLFSTYRDAPNEMPDEFAERCRSTARADAQARVVADFIAGMTDRYALREHERLTGLRLLS
jgi:dGTPase